MNDPFEIYNSGAYSVEDDLFFLRQYDQFVHTKKRKKFFSYQPKETSELVILREKYNLEEIAGAENDDLTRISKIRQWIHRWLMRTDNTLPIFNTLLECNKIENWNADIIMQRGKHPDFKVDCATFAIVQTEMLLALGYKARWIQCLPFDLRYNESHCISHVFIPSLQKWIIVDAAQDLFYFNRKGVPVSLLEMRQAFISGEKIYIFSTRDKEIGRTKLLDYWVKNLFRFRSIDKSEYGFFSKKPQVNIYLDPLNYSITDKFPTSAHATAHLHTNCAEEFFEI